MFEIVILCLKHHRGVGWVRYTGHHVDWLADEKFDALLSKGCRVWALAEDDGALDFDGVNACVCCAQLSVGRVSWIRSVQISPAPSYL